MRAVAHAAAWLGLGLGLGSPNPNPIPNPNPNPNPYSSPNAAAWRRTVLGRRRRRRCEAACRSIEAQRLAKRLQRARLLVTKLHGRQTRTLEQPG